MAPMQSPAEFVNGLDLTRFTASERSALAQRTLFIRRPATPFVCVSWSPLREIPRGYVSVSPGQCGIIDGQVQRGTGVSVVTLTPPRAEPSPADVAAETLRRRRQREADEALARSRGTTRRPRRPRAPRPARPPRPPRLARRPRPPRAPRAPREPRSPRVPKTKGVTEQVVCVYVKRHDGRIVFDAVRAVHPGTPRVDSLGQELLFLPFGANGCLTPSCDGPLSDWLSRLLSVVPAGWRVADTQIIEAARVSQARALVRRRARPPRGFAPIPLEEEQPEATVVRLTTATAPAGIWFYEPLDATAAAFAGGFRLVRSRHNYDNPHGHWPGRWLVHAQSQRTDIPIID